MGTLDSRIPPSTKRYFGSSQSDAGVFSHQPGNPSWNVSLLQEHFDEDSVTAICRIHLPLRPSPDKLCWIADPKGVFSVKSVYKSNHSHTWPCNPDPCWKDLWKCKLHERLKTLIWRIGCNALPTNLNIFSRLSKGSPYVRFVVLKWSLSPICSSSAKSPEYFGSGLVGEFELICYQWPLKWMWSSWL
jgi:hypothetical protein